MNEIIKKYYDLGLLKDLLTKEDKSNVVIMYEKILKYIKDNPDYKESFTFCGVYVDFIKTCFAVCKSFYIRYGYFNSLNVVDDFHKFCLLCEMGYFDDVITEDNCEKTIIYIFIGYSFNLKWFNYNKIKNIHINLN